MVENLNSERLDQLPNGSATPVSISKQWADCPFIHLVIFFVLFCFIISLVFQVRDYDFREHLSTIAPTEQRDMVLGNDANSWSYLYFPIFSASDLRIYKQCPLDVPTLNKRKKKVS